MDRPPERDIDKARHAGPRLSLSDPLHSRRLHESERSVLSAWQPALRQKRRSKRRPSYDPENRTAVPKTVSPGDNTIDASFNTHLLTHPSLEASPVSTPHASPLLVPTISPAQESTACAASPTAHAQVAGSSWAAANESDSWLRWMASMWQVRS